MNPATELSNQTRGPLETLQNTAARAAKILADFRGALARIEGDDRYVDEVKDAMRAEAQKRAESGFTQLAAAVAGARQAVQAALTNPPAGPMSDETRLVRESQMTRAWHRLKGLLDSGGDPLEVAREANEIELAVLREELPAYLRTVASPDEAAAVMTALAQDDLPAMAEVDRKVLEIRARFEELSHCAENCLNSGRHEVATGGRDQVPYLPSTKSDGIHLDDARAAA